MTSQKDLQIRFSSISAIMGKPQITVAVINLMAHAVCVIRAPRNTTDFHTHCYIYRIA